MCHPDLCAGIPRYIVLQGRRGDIYGQSDKDSSEDS
eukprot:COSAG03_NODE_22352_length_292_cov_0.756477_1_plen_35_part_01